MEWINLIVGSICSLVGAFTGGGILFFKYNKQLKQQEVIRNQADEWKRLYEEADEERKSKDAVIAKKDEKIDELYKERNTESRGRMNAEMEVQRLRWYHCTVSGCTKRRPPHVFDTQGNELEAQNEK
jgi:hypothetical protein